MRNPVQLSLTLLSAAIVIAVWRATGCRGPANLVAILAPPIAIGVVGNEGRDQMFMAVALTAVHWVVVSILGALVIRY